MKRFTFVAVFLILLTAGTALASVQTAELTPTQAAMVGAWKNFMTKVIVMAEDEGYPEEKFYSRPHPDSRSYAEELRHVALTSRAFAARTRGEEVDFSALRAQEKQPATRAEMVAALKEASEDFTKLLEEKERPGLIGFLAGMSEHYGKLVTIYRLNGIVPPSSRK